MELTKEFKEFVTAHLNDEPSVLMLRYHGKNLPDINLKDAVLQIECRRKYGKKFRQTLGLCPDFYFPTRLVAEQSTSDLLASFHTRIAEEMECAGCADLTAGLGIDIFHLAASDKCQEAVACEILPNLAEALAFNGKALGLERKLKVCQGDCRDYLDALPDNALDLIFIDPARRDKNGLKVSALADCSPDVATLLPQIMRKSKSAMIKLSPMLDLSVVINQLNCNSIYIIGTSTECKETLVIVNKELQPGRPVKIFAVNIDRSGKDYEMEFYLNADKPINGIYGLPEPGDMIYEPFPAVAKCLATARTDFFEKTGLVKIASNTHLFFLPKSVMPQDDLTKFGTLSKVKELLPFSSHEIKKISKRISVAQVAAKNFGMSAEELHKKLHIREGASKSRVIGFRDSANNKWLLVCELK